MTDTNPADGLSRARTGPRVEINYHRLAARRIELGLTQSELAAKAGVSRVTVNSLETGKSTPRLYTAHALAYALDVPIEELVGVTPHYRPERGR